MSEMFMIMTAAFHSGRKESCSWPCTVSKKRDLAWLTPTNKESARCHQGGGEVTSGNVKPPGSGARNGGSVGWVVKALRGEGTLDGTMRLSERLAGGIFDFEATRNLFNGPR